MSKKTRMSRISIEMDNLLEKFAESMSEQSGRKVTKTEASFIIAIQNRQPPTIIKKRGKKFIVGGSMVSL